VSNAALTSLEVQGKRVDVLGRVQQVSQASSTVATIFKTGDLMFPFKQVYVFFVEIATSDGLALANSLSLTIGSGGTNDWSGGTVSISGVSGGGLANAYYHADATISRGQRRYQVIRVPQYTNASLGVGLTAIYAIGMIGRQRVPDEEAGVDADDGELPVAERVH